ncbi:hypothetical protein A2866_02420 [Candidatus Roizmanbacteria bacterium RIFCSPHIGHO2_01_FULL_39_8]|uniref:Cupin type-2 domain-containing protein n=2 Tax=Candidatus Roizmaniibacteriota TaxID=1752723 RepID=A0A1F7GUS4_9BACT|nr:MAG: hypothetical protein A2866_02420 [Candidatus Roizmanbacteria bacterium RIFCSPHIGHO2_01_FULL_39_8]OGK25244.1 MAG: hypothetical protein A3C28_02420 [Candidatus Roizmanbacteria bacterium RIFCSPHIGHO2_02_FULL_39_9]
MKVIHLKKVKKEKWRSPLFTDTVTKQTPVGEKDRADLNIDYVHFPKNVRNKFHKHSNDQVLIVTEGKGIVATRKKVAKVKKGDIVWAPAGEEHWHGAIKGSKFSHVSVTRAKTKLTQIEK